MRNTVSLFLKILLFSLFAFFLSMLYWSNLLQEEKLQEIQNTLKEIQKVQKKPHNFAINNFQSPKIDRPHIKKNLPNLLPKDPYFSNYLPEKLKNLPTPTGTLRFATISAVDNLLPFTPWVTTSSWINYCQGYVGRHHVVTYESFAPDLAIKIEKRTGRDENHVEFWVHLRDDVNWQPLNRKNFPSSMQIADHFFKPHPLTAHDFVFHWNAVSNPHVDMPKAVTQRRLLFFIKDIRAVDDKTFVVDIEKTTPSGAENGKKHFPYAMLRTVAFLQPLPRFVYQHLPNGEKITPDDHEEHFYKKSSLWAQYFARHFASRVIPSCGAWSFEGLTDQSIRFRRNPDYHNPFQVLYENMEISLTNTEDAVFRDFIAQKSDTCTLTPKNTTEVEKYKKTPDYKKEQENGYEINQIDYLASIYSFLGWNQKRPFFADKKVRKALTHAIDRESMITQNLDGRAVIVNGPFSYSSESYNHTLKPHKYDPELAKL